jgi:hypothetical protein
MGSSYMACKEAIQTSFQVRNVDRFDQLLSEPRSEELLPYLCTAFYQNITLLYKTLQDQASQMSEMFRPLVRKYFKIDESFVMCLLDNNYKNALRVDEANWKEIDFNMLLVQLKYTILYSQSHLIKSLRDMLINPAAMAERYLPTMVQDEVFDVKTALVAGTHLESTKFYSEVFIRIK